MATQWPLAGVRVLIGYMFMKAGWGKVSAGADWVPRMEGFVNRHLEAGNVFGFYQWFLEGVVMKFPAVFAYLVAYGELLVGVALILGALTRLAGFFGVFMVASFLFTKGHSITVLAANNHDTLWILLFVVAMFAGANRTLGVDRFLRDRFGAQRFLW
jgi:uncharacterized membrane protein YphA (DoxX/SURF4 family)